MLNIKISQISTMQVRHNTELPNLLIDIKSDNSAIRGEIIQCAISQ